MSETIGVQWVERTNYDKREQTTKRSNVIGKDEVGGSNPPSSSKKTFES